MINDFLYRHGDICWMQDSDPQPGETYVLHGNRPCVVVSANDNRSSATLIVAPITHTIKTRLYPGQFDIALDGEISRVRCDQLRVVDKRQLAPPHAFLSHNLIKKLDKTLAEILGPESSENVAQEVQSV